MSQFYAEIQGPRGQVSRTGSKSSGITGHIRGWSVGARVDCIHVDGKDIVRVYRTTGSNGGKEDELVAEFSNDNT